MPLQIYSTANETMSRKKPPLYGNKKEDVPFETSSLFILKLIEIRRGLHPYRLYRRASSQQLRYKHRHRA